MLIERTLKEFALDTMSGEPTPGGGSVSAYAGTLGVALARMVGGLTFGKKSYDELSDDIKQKLESSDNELKYLFEELAETVDKDSKAFDKVVEAFKLPKGSDEEKKIRAAAVQEGYKIALEVPMACAEKCLRVLELQGVFTEYGNINTITDIGVGVLMAYSGLEGALLNVTINLGSIKDEEYIASVSQKTEKLLKQAKELKEKHLEVVYRRLNS